MKELEVKDLRVGSFVFIPKTKQYAEISFVNELGFIGVNKDVIGLGGLTIKDIKPIILTESILKDFGFKSKDRTSHETGFELFDIVKSKRIYIRTRIDVICRVFFNVFNHSECHKDEIQFIKKIEFVHELQDVCRFLSEKDFEFKLLKQPQ